MEEILKVFHEICEVWDIEHRCELSEQVHLEDLTLWNFARHTIEEQKSSRTIMTREFPDPIDLIEIDQNFCKTLKLDDPEDREGLLELSEVEKNFREICEKQRKKYQKPDYQKSLKYVSNEMEFVKNPSRIMCVTNSSYMYPDVPHRWLGNGKMLRLMDPGEFTWFFSLNSNLMEFSL
jgi:hypothetical protein